jgi:hypothetical protein
MLPSRAFKKLGKHLTTFEGGSDDSPEYIPMKPARATTGFGTGLADPEKGKYSYTLDPRLAAMRDIFYGSTSQFMPTAEQQAFTQGVSGQGMQTYGRGSELLNQALGLDTNQVAQQYYNDVQGLMAGDRAQEEARLADTLFNTGRTGLGIGVEGGYVNPQQFSLQRAREEANTRLGIEAQQLARQQRTGDIASALGIQQGGLGNYQAGYASGALPYQTMAGLFGLGTGIEQTGMQGTLGAAMAGLPYQAQIQQNRQAIENASASGGKGGIGGALGGIGDAFSGGFLKSALPDWGQTLFDIGASYYTGGMSDATGMAGGVGKEAWMYSDERLKTNIKKIGTYDNGLNKYSFTYVWGTPSIGVLAQEAIKVVPEAVRENNGYYEVNYDMIGQ